MTDSMTTVTYDEKKYSVVKEGLAEILFPVQGDDSKTPPSVFYNPIQQFNRDLSVLAIRVFSEDYNVWRSNKHAPRKRKVLNGKRKRELDDGTMELDTKKTKLAVEEDAESTGLDTEHEGVHQAEGSSVEAVPDQNGGNDAPITKDPPADAPRGPKHEQKHPFRVLDALSATGLRALRYSKEIDAVTMVTANDLSASAIDSIKLHTAHNKLTGKIFPLQGNAMAHMYHVGSDGAPILPDGNRGKYQVVDLDPYGTAAPFLDAAIHALSEGGLLCVTCTDSGVFASQGYSEKTFSQYGGLPIVGPISHEGGLRLLLHAVATSAARYGMAIEPVLSLSIDFYIRAFVRLRRSPSEVKLLAGKTMVVYNCDAGCGSWTVQPLGRAQSQSNRNGDPGFKFSLAQGPTASSRCEHCGFKTHLSGPMWGGVLHNPAFIQRMLDVLPTLDKEVYGTIPRMEGMLTTARDELLLAAEDLPAEPLVEAVEAESIEKHAKSLIPRVPLHLRDPHPFFQMPSTMAKVLHCTAPSIAYLRSALLGLGYRVTRSHTKPGNVRTDAPWSVMWEIMREWVRQKAPIKEGSLKSGSPGIVIMRKDRTNIGLQKINKDLRHLADTGDDVAKVKESLQAMLWRLEHSTDGTNGNEQTAIEGQTAQIGSGDVSQLEIVFDEALGKEPMAKRVVRYQKNPTKDWGPKSRARG